MLLLRLRNESGIVSLCRQDALGSAAQTLCGFLPLRVGTGYKVLESSSAVCVQALAKFGDRLQQRILRLRQFIFSYEPDRQGPQAKDSHCPIDCQDRGKAKEDSAAHFLVSEPQFHVGLV